MKTLIFDFDGTIADSFEVFLSIFEDITNRPQPLSDHEISQLRDKTLKQIIKYLKIKSWQIPRMIIKAKREVKLRINEVEPFAGLPQIIRQLHKDGYEMLILSTNNAQTIGRFLKTNGLDDCFSGTYGDIGLRGKAAGLKKVIKKHRLNRADCAYIGDEARDIEAAKKVGITSVAVGWGFNLPATLQKSQPSALARQPKDLIKIIEG